MAHRHIIEIAVMRARAAADKLHAEKQRERERQRHEKREAQERARAEEAVAKVTGVCSDHGNGSTMDGIGSTRKISSSKSVSPE